MNKRLSLKTVFQVSVVLFAVLLFASCAAKQAYNDGWEAERMENWDKAIYYYTVALQNDPDNVEYKIKLDSTKKRASREHLKTAKILFNQGKAVESFSEFKLAIDMDPQNQNAIFEYNRARDSYRKMLDEQRRKKKEEIRAMTSQGLPRLELKSPTKITLDFTNKRIKEIYVAMGKLAGINIFFEDTLKNNLTEFTVKDVSFVEALETFAMANRHQIKVINNTSLFIYPDTAQMRKEYQSQVMRVFFFDNLPVKNARDYFRTILGFTRMHWSDDLNAIIVRGTPGQIAAADRLAEIIDRPKAEVIIDIEVLEVSRNVLNNIGFLVGDDASITQSTASIVVDETEGTATVGSNNLSFTELDNLTSTNLFLTVPSLTMNFLRQDSDTRLVAKPRIAIVDKEKANMHVGESVPVRSTTFNPASTVGGNVVPIDSYQYKDIGIKLEFEPSINNQLEVTLKLKVEISSKLFENEAGLPTFGKKEINSVIRLRDGETNMLAGLIKEDKKTTITGISGLSEIPLLGKLFSNSRDEVVSQDTIITITPYIIRSSEITEDDLRGVLIGTENDLGLSLADIFNHKPSDDDETVVIDNNKINELLKDEVIADKSVPSRDSSTLDRTPPLEQPPVDMPDNGNIQQGTAQVNIQPSVVSIARDSQFSVQVAIKDAENVAHTPFYLIFDPNFLEVENVTEGAFLGQDGKQVSFLHNINNSTGEIRVGLSRLGALEGVNGSGVLAVVTFKAKAEGKTYLTFTNCSVKDPRAENLSSEWLPGEVEID